MHAVRNMWVLLVAVALVPIAQAQDVEVGFNNPTDTPTPTTMYIHLNDFQDAPINTQAPASEYSQASDIGLTQHSQGCYENPGGSMLAETHHTFYAFSSPGYVQYDKIEEGGKPRYHNERGISYDLKLEPGSTVDLEWFMESQLTSQDLGADPNTAPVVVPQVVVRATLREGDDISVGSTAYNDGKLIAQGEVGPVDLSPAVSNEFVSYQQVGQKHLYGFTFPLELDQTTITGSEGYNLRIDVFMDNPACNTPEDDAYLMPDFVRIHTSEAYRPKFTWNVMNPIEIVSLHPQGIGDELIVHAHMNSVFGNYDVRGDSYDGGETPMVVIGGGPSMPVGLKLETFAEHFGNHGPTTHIEPVAAAWSWPTVEEKAQPGEYTVSLEIQNDQESAVASAVAKFGIGSNHKVGEVTGCGYQDAEGCVTEDVPENRDTVEESPGVGLFAVLALLGAAGFVLRRRN